MNTAAAMASATTISLAAISPLSKASVSRVASRPAFVSKRAVHVRCNVEPESKPSPVEKVSSVTPIVPPTPTPVVPKKTAPSFGDVFAFTGPAPETINGRLAMLGFVAALGAELATGETLTAQLRDGGVSAFAFAAILFTTASLIPMFQGVSTKSKSKSFFSADAELWNGRAAMIGLVALAITEYVSGNPLV